MQFPIKPIQVPATVADTARVLSISIFDNGAGGTRLTASLVPIASGDPGTPLGKTRTVSISDVDAVAKSNPALTDALAALAAAIGVYIDAGLFTGTATTVSPKGDASPIASVKP